jgi:hypothetical protein
MVLHLIKTDVVTNTTVHLRARSAPSEWPRLAIAEAEGHILLNAWNSDKVSRYS